MTEITTLLDKIHTPQSAFAAARTLYANRRAPEFSPFEFSQANELRLSSIVAWMLHPRALIAKARASFSGSIGRTEMPTTRLDADRRIDILVQHSHCWSALK